MNDKAPAIDRIKFDDRKNMRCPYTMVDNQIKQMILELELEKMIMIEILYPK